MDPHALTQHQCARAERNPETGIKLPSTTTGLFAVGLSQHAMAGTAIGDPLLLASLVRRLPSSFPQRRGVRRRSRDPVRSLSQCTSIVEAAGVGVSGPWHTLPSPPPH
jgi:hypothetical protein